MQVCADTPCFRTNLQQRVPIALLRQRVSIAQLLQGVSIAVIRLVPPAFRDLVDGAGEVTPRGEEIRHFAMLQTVRKQEENR